MLSLVSSNAMAFAPVAAPMLQTSARATAKMAFIDTLCAAAACEGLGG